jgi:replicative DNA helicase
VALADERGTDSSSPDGYAGYDGTFEKQPPQDVAAEQSVLGGMMLSKDAIADVVEVLRPGDFYRPAHHSIYDCVLELYGRGEPVDAITVSAELERRGELLRVGGAPYMHTLIATVPTAANAGYYAEIVAEKAVLRRLVEAGTRIVQLGYHGSEGSDIDEVVDRAQAAIYDVTERRTSEDYASLEELLQPTMDEIDAIASRGDSIGIPTGFADLDAVTNGLHPGQMIIVAARPGVGKALALDTPLPTPTGWTTMGEVLAGELLIGADGSPTRVVAATEVLTGRPCYEIEFSDGTAVVADAEHQWVVDGRVAATHQLADLPAPREVPRHERLRLPVTELPVDPYVLGVWLAVGRGDGGLGAADEELIDALELAGLAARGPRPVFAGEIAEELAGLGIWDDQDVPARYLRAGVEQRRALLAGLLDAAGRPTGDGLVELTVSEPLSVRVRELVLSLGYPCTAAPVVEAAIDAEFDQSTLVFDSGCDEVFRLGGKNESHKSHRSTGSPGRTIVSVRPAPSVPVRCVEVAAVDGLYLATRSMIVTHNSTLGLDFARSASIQHGLASVIFSLEMGRTEIVMRLLSAEARIRLGDVRGGRLTDDDWTRLARLMGEISDAPLFIDDSPNLTMMEIRAKARRLKQRNDIKLIVVDYMQLMTSGKRVESRQQEVSEFSRNLKLLAKELEVPVVAISQLNRGPEQRTDKRPQLADLRESGCLTRETTLLRADTGAPISFGTLLDEGYDGVMVWSLDDQRRMVPAPITNVFPSGVKATFQLKLASGRTVTASGNHKFLAFDGWRALDTLAAGDRIAVPRHIPVAIGAGLGWSEQRIGLLAHLIGDGCVVRSQPVHYTSQDEANLAFVERAVSDEFGITARRVQQGNWQQLYLPSPWRCTHGRGNPLHVWLRELGIEDLCSYEKRIPDVLYQADDNEIRIFLRHLGATDDCVFVPTEKSSYESSPRVYYSTPSRELASGLTVLLTRLGIPSRQYRVTHTRSTRPGWHVAVAGSTGIRRFCEEIGVYGQRGESAVASLKSTPVKANMSVDTLPVWGLAKTERVPVALTEHQFQAAVGTNYRGSAPYKSCPSRQRLLRRADPLDSEVPRDATTDNVFWDKVVSIEPMGQQPVYDATVKGTHNFIANGIVAHNSIEQDSDMVILIHRPDAFERDDPRMGEADLILAKHRSGPTATVTVAHQLHYSRFVDMARE